MKEKICVICQKKFIDNTIPQNKKICSPECVKIRRKKKRIIPTERKCVICQETFYTTHNLKKTCSSGCSDKLQILNSFEYHKRKYIYKTNLLKNQKCKKCGKIFVPTSCLQIYCSLNCSNRQSNFFLEILTYFFKKYFEFGNYSMHYKYIFYCMQNEFRKHNLVLSRYLLTSFLKQQQGIKFEVQKTKKTIKIVYGLRLNKKGMKKYNLESNLCNIKKEKPLLTSKEVCIGVSCEPGRERLETIYTKCSKDIKDKINLDKTINHYKKIEKLLFQKNVYRASAIKIALALYLVNKTNKITQKECCELCNTTPESLRSLLKVISVREADPK